MIVKKDLHERFVKQEVLGQYSGYELLSGIGTARIMLDLNSLRALRLVSKTVSDAATRTILKSVPAVIAPFQRNHFADDAGQDIEHLAGDMGPCVKGIVRKSARHLKFEFTTGLYYDTKRPFTQWLAAGTTGSDTESEKIDKFIQTLPAIMAQLSQLRVLQIQFPSMQSYYGGGEEDWAPNINLTHHDLLIAAIHGSLRPFPKTLTSLSLELPCAHDFVGLEGLLLESDSSNWSAVHHLYLGLTDATGPGGSEQYLFWTEDDSDGDEFCPMSNLQERHSNRLLSATLTRITCFFKNLKSLGLSGTQYIEMKSDLWHLEGPGLETLHLNRVWTTPKDLVAFMSPALCAETKLPWHTKHLFLSEVDLAEGTWSEIFSAIDKNATQLLGFDVENLGYTLHGESHELREPFHRRWEDSRVIWSMYEEDFEDLRTLKEGILERAGG